MRISRTEIHRRARRLSLALLGSALIAGGSLPALAQTAAGVTAAVNPQATGTPPAQAPRVLEVGTNIVQNERIATGPEGQTQLLFSDGSTVSLGPNSHLTIDEYVYNPGTKTAKLAMTAAVGVFRFVGGRASKEDPVVIKTPTATVGIRGGINYTTVAPGSGETETAQAFGRDTSVVSSSTGERRILTKNGFALVVRNGEQIISSRFDFDRLTRLLGSFQGRPGLTGGATGSPDQGSAAAQGLASVNSGQSTDSNTPPDSKSANISLDTVAQVTNATGRLVSQTVQSTQTTTGSSVLPVFTSGTYAGGVASPGIRPGSTDSQGSLLFGGGPYGTLNYTITSGNTSIPVTSSASGDTTITNGVPESFSSTSTTTFNVSGTTSRSIQQTVATLRNATVQELGGDNVIQYGRLTGGAATYVSSFSNTSGTQTTTTQTGPFSTSLASNQSSHYVIGVPVTGGLPTGTLTYALQGATSPTFADGSGSPGRFTGSLSIAFGAQAQRGLTISGGATSLVVGFDGTVTMPGDASYRLSTIGGLDVAQQIAAIQAGSSSSGTITSTNALAGFSGSFIVVTPQGARACTSGNCTGNLLGFLSGSGASRAGILYVVGTPTVSNGQITNLSQLILGAAAFKR